MPPKKRRVALIFWRWKKNRNVRSKPMIMLRPARKRTFNWIRSYRQILPTIDGTLTFPTANKPLSKRNIIPNKIKPTPNIDRPRPISTKAMGSVTLDLPNRRILVSLLWKSVNWIGMIEVSIETVAINCLGRCCGIWMRERFSRHFRMSQRDT